LTSLLRCEPICLLAALVALPVSSLRLLEERAREIKGAAVVAAVPNPDTTAGATDPATVERRPGS